MEPIFPLAPPTSPQLLSTPSPPVQRAPTWSINTIPAFCITLERRPDRWRRFQDQPGLAGLPVQRFLGVDGKTLDVKTDPRIATLTKRNILQKTRRAHEELDSIGGVGCALSHLAVWTWMVENNQDYALIFEDDAVVPPGFVEKANQIIEESTVLRQPNGWDMWLLGGIWDDLSTIPQEPRQSGIIRVGSFVLFHAYVMTKAMAKQLIADAYPIHAHIDLWTSIDAYLNDFRVVGSQRLVLQQYQRAKTDIQTNGAGCAICNVPTDFAADSVVVSKSEQTLSRMSMVALGCLGVGWLVRRLII